MRRIVLVISFLAGLNTVFTGEVCAEHNRTIDSLQQLLETVKEDTAKVNTLIVLSSALGNKDPDKALEYGEQALQLSKKSGYKKGIASALNSIGIIHYYQSNYDKAIDYFFRSSKIDKQLGNKRSASMSFNNIGLVYWQQGVYERAVENFLKSLRITEGLGDEKGMVLGLNNLGLIYEAQGNNEKALEYYLRCLPMLKSDDDDDQKAGVLNNIGNIHNANGQLDTALAFYRRSLKIIAETGDKNGMALGLNNIGIIHLEKEDLKSALIALRQALEKFESLKNEQGMAMAMNNIALVYRTQGSYDRAIDFSKRSLNIATNLGAKDDIKEASKTLMETHVLLKNYKSAYEYLQMYTATKDSLYNEDKSKEIGRLEAKYEFEKAEEEQKRVEQEEARKLIVTTNRRNNLQYSGILIFIVILVTSLFGLGKIRVSVRMAEGLIFFTFLLFFEFTLVLLDPFIENYSSGAPAIKLAFNAVLAALIFPLHSFFEILLKKRIVK